MRSQWAEFQQQTWFKDGESMGKWCAIIAMEMWEHFQYSSSQGYFDYKKLLPQNGTGYFRPNYIFTLGQLRESVHTTCRVCSP